MGIKTSFFLLQIRETKEDADGAFTFWRTQIAFFVFCSGEDIRSLGWMVGIRVGRSSNKEKKPDGRKTRSGTRMSETGKKKPEGRKKRRGKRKTKKKKKKKLKESEVKWSAEVRVSEKKAKRGGSAQKEGGGGEEGRRGSTAPVLSGVVGGNLV